MFKNQYNTNPIVFSPDGQLLQLNFANKVAGISTTKLGAASSMPTLNEVEEY